MSFLYIPLKHVIVIFFLLVIKFDSSVCVCCVRVCCNDRADIDEGCLSKEMYGTACNPSSDTMIIKTIVLCDDKNKKRSFLTSGFVCLCKRMFV